jgi:hypothetical protein
MATRMRDTAAKTVNTGLYVYIKRRHMIKKDTMYNSKCAKLLFAIKEFTLEQAMKTSTVYGVAFEDMPWPH